MKQKLFQTLYRYLYFVYNIVDMKKKKKKTSDFKEANNIFLAMCTKIKKEGKGRCGAQGFYI